MGIDPQAPAYASHPTGVEASSPYVVCAMFTASFRAKAEHLVATLQAHGLAYAVFEVPHVHRSMSVQGVADLSHCKPRFIATLLRHFQRPIVYVDADFEFCRAPELFSTYGAAQTDFAIYNWLPDLMNDAWGPELGRPERHANGHARFWRFGFAIEKFSTTQMLCSGGVQYWAPTGAAHGLLSAWEREIAASPQTPDDENLDLAFNFRQDACPGLRPAWLPKSYSRSAQWFYVDPTINHRDIPSPRVEGQFRHLGDARVNAAVLTDVSKARPYPRGAVVDIVAEKLIFTDATGQAVAMPLTLPVYL